MKKITITSKQAHFKIPYATKYQKTYRIPPVSTIIGILKVIFDENIDDFVFGYTFSYDSIYEDTMMVYKTNIKGIKENSFTSKNNSVTDVVIRQYLYDCILNIYTNIDKPIKMNYCLNMGRANCLARVHFPFNEVKLIDRLGTGYNQYTPISIGKGIIKPITYFSEYDKKTQSFNTKTKNLRLNKEFEYDKNFDTEEEQNIFLWHFRGGEIYEFS